MTNLFLRAKELFPANDIGSGIGNVSVRKYSFEAIFLQDNSALLARANHNLAMNFANTRGQSALLWEKDCFECISLP